MMLHPGLGSAEDRVMPSMRRFLPSEATIAIVFGLFLFVATTLGTYLVLHVHAYGHAKVKIEKERRALAMAFRQAANATERDAVIARAGRVMARAITRKLLPAWYGTPWSFNGVTEKPRAGTIACGALVAIVLRDVGIKLAPREMTVLAAERMIRSLVAPENIRRWQDAPEQKFLDDMRKWGTGLYQIGLDSHTGLMLVEKDELYFIHATRRFPYTVVKEKASESKTLLQSRYRIAGKVSADRGLLEKWLASEAVPVSSWGLGKARSTPILMGAYAP